MSFTSSFLHLDGIEFKISDSLQVPTVEGLPSNFRMTDPSELLLESEYDFSRERKVLEKIKSVREAERKMAEQEEKRKQLSLKRRSDAEKNRHEEILNQQREVIQQQRELFLQQKRKQKQENEDADSQAPDRASSSEEGGTSKASSTSEIVLEECPPIPPTNPFLRVGKDDILMPQPAARKIQDSTASSSQERVNQSQPVISGQDQIWVDFEDRELDPFSNMELKTIDDMAELQTVLENAKIDPPKDDTITSNADYLPSYDEATSPKFGEISAPTEPSTRLYTSTHPGAETSSKPDPLYSDVDEISLKFEFDVKTANTESMESNLPPGGTDQTYENIGFAANNQPVACNLSQEESNLPKRLGRKSPDVVMAERPETLYENVGIAKVSEIAKKLERPSSRPLKSRNTNESLYDFANDTTFKKEDNRTAEIRSIFEKKLSAKTVEGPSSNPKPIYSVIRPTIRAFKSPDTTPASSIQQIPVSSSLNQSNQVSSSGIQSQLTSSKNLTPVLPRQTRSRPEITGIPVQGQINSAFPPPSQHTPSGATKVLPVSFGGVSNSLSSPVLPPITNTVSNGANYINFTPGSLSTPNLIQAPTPAPRRPPLPPRDPKTTETTPQVQYVGPHPPAASSPNGTNRPITTLGHTHLLPPYALPQPNDPNVTLSPTTATFTNHKPSPMDHKVTTAPSSVAASFIQKSREDRAKFAQTVNKALGSLPKNPPKPVVMHKPTMPTQHVNESHTKPSAQAFSNYPALPSKTKSLSLKSSLLAGLSSEEQEFVKNVTSMGFDTKPTTRAMQKYGLNVKEVVDHLCNVQDIVEQGFLSSTVQDALEMFENDNKSVIKYIQQASQLIDMGFKEDNVRDALKLSNNDQTKALDQLMGQS